MTEIIIKDKETFHAKSEKNYLLIICIAVIAIAIALIAFILLRKKHKKSIKTHEEEQSFCKIV